jgi:Flp pilus assembly protein CpaB
VALQIVTLKVSPEERARWQLAANRQARGNLSEWLRQAAAERIERLPKVRAHTVPERASRGHTRPFRGMDTKSDPLRR